MGILVLIRRNDHTISKLSAIFYREMGILVLIRRNDHTLLEMSAIFCRGQGGLFDSVHPSQQLKPQRVDLSANLMRSQLDVSQMKQSGRWNRSFAMENMLGNSISCFLDDTNELTSSSQFSLVTNQRQEVCNYLMRLFPGWWGGQMKTSSQILAEAH